MQPQGKILKSVFRDIRNSQLAQYIQNSFLVVQNYLLNRAGLALFPNMLHRTACTNESVMLFSHRISAR